MLAIAGSALPGAARKSRRRPLRAALPCLALCLAAPVSCVAFRESVDPAAPKAVDGRLDLSSWNPAAGTVPLSGEWDFFPARLLGGDEAARAPAPAARPVPDAWKAAEAGGTGGRGAGTYRLTIILPPDAGELAVETRTVSTAFELEADGVLVAAAGKPDIDPRGARPAYAPAVARLPGRPGGPGELVLVARVSNHEYRTGGMWRAFILGPAGRLEADARERRDATMAVFGATLAAAVVFGSFFASRPRDRANGWFAAFAATVALRAILTGDYVLTDFFPALPFGVLIRLEYLTSFLLPPLGLAFVADLFPEELPRRILVGAMAPFAALLLLLASPLRILTRSVFVFSLLAFALMALAMATNAKAALRRRPGARTMLVAAAVFVIAAVNDILYSLFIVDTANLMPAALGVYVLAQVFILARRLTGAFRTAELASDALAKSNAGLDGEVRARTAQLEEAYNRIKELSVRDPLTGVYNRRYLDAELAREAARALRYRIPLSVLFCDLDRFKEVNDRFGHAAGDAVLAFFARTAIGAMRDRIDWAARYGGEEFVLVVPGTSTRDAAMLGERIRALTEDSVVETGERRIRFTVSVGVAGCEAASCEAEAAAARLLARADEAMYEAKRGGRNRVSIYDPERGPADPRSRS